MVLKDDFVGIIDIIKKVDIKYIVLAIIVYILSVSTKGFVNYLIINNKQKIGILEAIKHNFIAHFFAGVTPFSSGGQPMEIYLICEHNISLSKATNYSIQGFVFYQMALVIFGILAIIYDSIFHIFSNITYLKYFVILGLGINTLIAIVLIIISRSKKTTNIICKLVLKISKKLKLKITETEIIDKFDDYYKVSCELKKKKKLMLSGIILNLVSLTLLYIIPLIIVRGFHDYSNLNVLNTLITSAYIYIVGGLVPMPGGSGGIEYSFNQFFGTFITKNKLSALLLIWRTITYYFGVIAGALLFSLEKKVKRCE